MGSRTASAAKVSCVPEAPLLPPLPALYTLAAHEAPQGQVNVNGICTTMEEIFSDVGPVKILGNLLLLESPSLLSQITAAAGSGSPSEKGNAVKMATWAVLREFNDVFDFVFVVPYGLESGSNTFYTIMPETTNGVLRG